MEGKGIITVVGKDKVGIIYSVTKVLAENNVNVEDISQTILQDYFTMMMMVNLSSVSCEFNKLQEILEDLGKELGLSIRIQREEIFNYMHEI
ncbi:MAG: ACT domain-containing protein [Spirochaetales bacterium]|nr:ACT domain-containing protein [Spirochaetales bacterium]